MINPCYRTDNYLHLIFWINSNPLRLYLNLNQMISYLAKDSINSFWVILSFARVNSKTDCNLEIISVEKSFVSAKVTSLYDFVNF